MIDRNQEDRPIFSEPTLHTLRLFSHPAQQSVMYELNQSTDSLSLSRMQEQTGVSPSTIVRYMKESVMIGLVDQARKREGFQLTGLGRLAYERITDTCRVLEEARKAALPKEVENALDQMSEDQLSALAKRIEGRLRS